MHTSGDFDRALDENILLQGVNLERSEEDWFECLYSDPFFGSHASSLTEYRKGLLIDGLKNAFLPDALTAKLAEQIQRMLLLGLVDRNPDDAANVRAMFEIASLRDRRVEDLPWRPITGRGLLLQGITSQGKSHFIKRLLFHFPQVIDRGEVPQLGLRSFKQLMHLTVPMPSDASKAGFVLAAFKALDTALGTSYEAQYMRTSLSVDKQLVHLIALFVQHRLGLLVIEEAQKDHQIEQVRFGRDFALIFMQIINWGVPTVFVANPLAFVDLESHMQVFGRICSEGIYTFEPAPTSEDPTWQVDLVEALWRMTIFRRADAPVADLPRKLWLATGGFKKHLVSIRVHALRCALKDGADRVEEFHLQAAIKEARKHRDMRLIDAFIRRDDVALASMKDVPGEYFAQVWKAHPPPGSSTRNGSKESAPSGPTESKPIPWSPTPKTSKAGWRSAKDAPPNQDGPAAQQSAQIAASEPDQSDNAEDLRLPRNQVRFRGPASEGAVCGA